MASVINEKVYNKTLISKIKEHTGPKKLKKIINHLRKIAEDDIKESYALKIKIFEEKKEQEVNLELNIDASTIEVKHYTEDLRENSRMIVNKDGESEEDNSTCTVNDKNKEFKQIDSSDLSDDE